MTSNQSPSVADIERIASLADPVIRNLHITQCYYELARPLAEKLPGNASWCTFATWASKQAGQTIRKQDLARTLELVLGSQEAARQAVGDLASAIASLSSKPETGQIVKFILQVMDPPSAFDRSSEAVARGNLKVFAEIGREFARFNAACLGDTAYDAGNIEAFCEELLPGEPPEGQRYLHQAFKHYYRALFETDDKEQIELLLLANLEIGFHEQTRLQPEINEALDAPIISPEQFTRNLLRALRPNWGRLNDLVWYVMRLFGRLTNLDARVDACLAAAQREAQWIVTETMMTIALPPPNLLRLGMDLQAAFPPELKQISNPELLALLARIDPSADSLTGSGAKYWGDLPDRMHFIADMFRCYQTAPELSEPPFTSSQTADMKAGRLPSGSL